jgi:hypothetical protein
MRKPFDDILDEMTEVRDADPMPWKCVSKP